MAANFDTHITRIGSEDGVALLPYVRTSCGPRLLSPYPQLPQTYIPRSTVPHAFVGDQPAADG